ncbi:LCP family protein [Streptomyces sp. NPDC050485]|uniref:LCP family protein n=1 Tax=Streptomyces sp. NPDC050485 TaxID=3365617 RepID=UPI0037BC6C7F
MLVVGTAARTDGNSDLGGGNKNDIARSDTAFLPHTHADQKHAVAVSIPRDQASDPSPSPSAPEFVSGKGIPVAVFNATTVTGLATRAVDALKQHGFTVTGTTTAQRQDHQVTVITYGPGRKARAETLARRFPGAELQPSTAPGDTVILGKTSADRPQANPSAVPASSPTPDTLPSSVRGRARSADDDPCSNLSYG